jgi:hypothetical protein
MTGYVKKGYKRKIDLTQATFLYEAGYSIPHIGRHFGVTKQAAHSALIKAGVHTSTPRGIAPPLSDEEREEARRLYEEYVQRLTVTRYRNAKIQEKAREKVLKAIARGVLRPGPCEVCGTTAKGSDGRRDVHAHHDDYSRPLAVRWLCSKHHKQWHKTNTPKY